MSPLRVIACDWSGALDARTQQRAIACASCDPASGVLTLTRGRTRDAVEAELAALGRAGEPVVAGLDFSFSLPACFLREQGCADAPALWALAASEGEHWLRKPHRHFWGRAAGSRQPSDHRGPLWLGYRQTERDAATAVGRLPASTFQIGGAGAPGTASVRGMPMLARLRAAGWHIWPFDPPRLPLLVEIYPRLLTGPVVKSSAAARAAYLAAPGYARLDAAIRAEAEGSEDAFDALVSAAAMARHAARFLALPWPTPALNTLEGAIWRPAAD